MMSNSEAQENELQSMQSIYNEQEFVVDNMDPPSGRILAEVRLSEEFYVRAADRSKPPSDPKKEEIFQIAHLPPIILSFLFPKTYPLQTCPEFSLSCNWLTLEQLSVLCKVLEALWDMNKEAVLYTWMQFLQDQSLDILNIGHCLDITDLLNLEMGLDFQALSINNSHHHCVKVDEKTIEHYKVVDSVLNSISGRNEKIDSRAVNQLGFGRLLIQLLKDYNSSKVEDVFRSSYQECQVCLLTQKGREFVVFKDCRHFFCSNCVKGYYKSQIGDGNVSSLKCLEGQCETSAEVSTIKELVGADLYEKYEKLLLSSTLDSMSDVAYCPRKECQCACVIDISERMGECSACGFIFCPFCMMTYHGVHPCDFKKEKQKRIFDEFVSGNALKKKEIEKRYGKRLIKSLIEDTLSESWKNTNSKSCPRCQTSVEKTYGCNKMTCYRCGAFFCWLCLKLLNSSNPYSHYSEQDSECFERLFPAEIILNDNFDDPPQENWNEEFDVQPGEYLNHLNQEFDIQPGEYLNHLM